MSTLCLNHNQTITVRKDKVYVTGKCLNSGEVYETGPLEKQKLLSWLRGEPIHKALKGVPIEDILFLQEGTCAEEYCLTDDLGLV